MNESDLPPWHEIKDAQLGYKAKIVKVSNKDCFDKKLKKTRCSSISYLREELEFVSWLPETKEFFEAVVKKGLMIQSKMLRKEKEQWSYLGRLISIRSLLNHLVIQLV